MQVHAMNVCMHLVSLIFLHVDEEGTKGGEKKQTHLNRLAHYGSFFLKVHLNNTLHFFEEFIFA